MRCLCRVVLGEGEIPQGARNAEGIQVKRWIDRLVQVSQAM